MKDKAGHKIILVEHETGLEILAAIGSVASLIALLPLISSGWTRLRHTFFPPPHFDRPNPEGVEIRRFDQNNVLVEEQAPSVEVYVLNATLQDYAGLKEKVMQLEAEIKDIKTQNLQAAKNISRAKGKKPKKR